MPFELSMGPAVTPEQMKVVLERNPITKAVVIRIFSEGVGIVLVRSSFYKASVNRRKRGTKIIPGFWEIMINLKQHKNETREELKISILHELVHLHLWRILGFMPESDLVPQALLGWANPKFREQREPREKIIEDYAQCLSDAEVVAFEELLELGNALLDINKYSFGEPRYVFASSNLELIDQALNPC